MGIFGALARPMIWLQYFLYRFPGAGRCHYLAHAGRVIYFGDVNQFCLMRRQLSTELGDQTLPMTKKRRRN